MANYKDVQFVAHFNHDRLLRRVERLSISWLDQLVGPTILRHFYDPQ